GGHPGGPILERVEGGTGGGLFPSVGPINTGTNTGVMAGGSVDHTIVGNQNEQANIQAPTQGSVLHFGSGDVSNIAGSTVDHSAVSAGGHATNVSGNTLGSGSALSTGSGGASGNYQSDSSFHQNIETSTVEADHSIVDTAQGHGQIHQQHTDLHQHADLHLHPGAIVDPVHEPAHDVIDPGHS
ncbi:MAG TPA: hypothetical protein VFE14_05430, partial [Micromonosporaceae bacterium]|nr:hypothetical protein [Micromonosporaceae bacterium]